MKIIDLDDLAFGAKLKAPINEKDVCSDVLLDAIYDDQSYAENDKYSVGFVNGYPTLVNYSGCSMEIHFNSPFLVADENRVKKEWSQEIVERLTDINMPSNKNHIYVLDEDVNLVYSITRFKNMLIIAFKYYQQ